MLRLVLLAILGGASLILLLRIVFDLLEVNPVLEMTLEDPGELPPTWDPGLAPDHGMAAR